MRVKHLKEEENIRLQQAELMAKFAELSPDIILRFDIDGKIVLANNSAHKILHKTSILGMNIYNVLPEIKQYSLNVIIMTGERRKFTEIIDEKHYEFIIDGVPDIQVGQLFGRDITDLKEKEKALKDALEKAEESEKLKADFLARISHEIRSPLVAIQGYSEMIIADLGDKLEEDYRGIFRSLDKNTKRLYRTVDLILNMSQLQTSTYVPRFEKTDLEEMLKNIHSEFQSFAQEKKIDFKYSNENGLNNTIMADQYSIHQVFVNLVDNAIKFTDVGSVEISLSRENNIPCVEVKDTGIGISNQYIDKIFSPFSQEKTGYTRPYEGTGLGLALVKNYVDLNKASISVKSVTKHGTAFKVSFQETENA